MKFGTKNDFTIFSYTLVKSKPLVYFDSAATSQKPRTVVNAERTWYEKHNANIHRGAYQLSERAEKIYQRSLDAIADFIGAPSKKNIIITRGATEGINLVAHSWGRFNLHRGDTVVLTEMEHHANIVPWQILAEEKKLRIKYWKINRSGQLDMRKLGAVLKDAKLLALTHISNVLGTINPVRRIAREARKRGAAVIIDAAQSAPHIPVNVSAIDPDWFVFSGHKMLGPTGIGVLYVKNNRFSEMRPFHGGGIMIKKVERSHSTYKKGNEMFEAGTQPLAQIYGLAAACVYLKRAGMDKIKKYIDGLVRYAYDALSKIPEVSIYGPPPASRAAILSFNVRGMHAHDLGTFLDRNGIAVRTGHHCAMPLHQTLGADATARISFHIYNNMREIDIFIRALKEIIRKWQASTKI